MNAKSEPTLTDVLRGMIMERQRLPIREANYVRGLVGLPPVRAEKGRSEEEALRHAAGGGNGSERLR